MAPTIDRPSTSTLYRAISCRERVDVSPASMRLLATSDLHLGHRANRDALAALPPHPDDRLIVAGDVGERVDHLVFALETLTPRFARVIWTPGNHDLWCPPDATDRTRGQARYDELVAVCRSFGAITPEDPYLEWPDGTGTRIVPMFLLFDYSFRPPDVPLDAAIRWARETGVGASDEQFLDPQPWPSRAAWCHARCDLTEARLAALPAGEPTVLINHWPLRYDLARPPRVPRFSLWCGTMRTNDWHRRFHARVVVSGHLHLRTTLWRSGVRFEEVSLGYPRDWQADRGLAWYLRDVLSDASPASARFTPGRDPFFDHPVDV
jgi:3',5'-cyclic AMP phosphodiesterase CpdA